MGLFKVLILVLFAIISGFYSYANEYPLANDFQFPVKDYIDKKNDNHFDACGEVYPCPIKHLGDDVSVAAGTNVKSPGNGIVKRAYNSNSYGGTYLIEHNTGQEIVVSLLAHLNYKTFTKSEGDTVEKGKYLGQIGTTEQNGGWPEHLHYEIRKGAYISTAKYYYCHEDEGWIWRWAYLGYSKNANYTENTKTDYDVTHDEMVNHFYNPTAFIESHQCADTPQDLSLARIEGQGTTYWIQNNKKYHILNPQILTDMSGIPGWGHICDFPSTTLDLYTDGPDFISTDPESDGLLIKLPDDPKIYLIENGSRRWVTSEAFNNLGFDFNDVIVVAQSIFDLFTEGNSITEGLAIRWTTQWRNYRGSNSINWLTGDRLVMSVGLDPVQTPNGQTDVVATNLYTGYSHFLFYVGNPVYNPYEFGRSVDYDPAKTGDWLVTATNGSDTATAYIPAIGDVEPLPFLRNVQIIGSGLTPTISWTVPAGTGADRVVIQVVDDILNIRLWRSSNIEIGVTQFTIPNGILEYGHPYVIVARLEDTVSGTINGFDKSRSSSFFNFTPLEEGEPSAVFLPTVGLDPDPTDEFAAPYTFDIDVEEGVPCFIDPFVAVGYDYETGVEDTVKFASVTLPEVGDSLFNLYLFDGSDFYLAERDLESGQTYNFGPEGVNLFRILGIEKANNIDPNDTTAFITELTFTGTGQFTGTMTPITAFVPEPGAGQICATLGDNSRKFIPDFDLFTFSAEEGEEVVLRLEADSDGWFQGEYATLILKDKIRRVWFFEMDNSALRNTINATLPATGEYRVIVAEQPKFRRKWFRARRFQGDYCLTLKSSQDARQTLEPTRSVE